MSRRLTGGLVLLVVAIGIGFSRSRPPAGPADPEQALDAHASVPAPVAAVLRRACFDCHSDDTRWPWYSRLPVGSWLMVRHVEAGRGQLNFSRWSTYNPFDRADMLDDMCALATSREMPLWTYRLVHRDATLSDADVSLLCAWTTAEADRQLQGGS